MWTGGAPAMTDSDQFMSNQDSPLTDNPLLDLSGLPRFRQIEPSLVEPALDAVLHQHRLQIQALESQADDAGWESFAEPLQGMEEQLERVWSPVSHLNAVRDSQELRTAVDACLPKISAFQSEVGQNRALYRGYHRIADSSGFAGLSAARRKVVQNALRDFRLAGAELKGSPRERFREIVTELASLANRFEQNLLDATDHWVLDLDETADLAGLPDSVVELAREAASAAGCPGWRFSLQAPFYLPFMMFSEHRRLRRQMYEAYVTRASEVGPDAKRFDSGDLMVEILTRRGEMARLLGFASYAEYALQDRMAGSPQEVSDFLERLTACTRPAAQVEFDELREFASSTHSHDDLQAWDIPYYSEKLKQSRFAFSDEQVRPYFPLPRVLEGLFAVTEKLFDIRAVKAECEHTWHEDVQFFELRDHTGVARGCFFLDLYARAHKRGGAWMADCIGRRRLADGALQLPAAFLTCNFMPPVGDKPSLLTHDDVVTLFHEFGHGLHHLLTQVDEAAVAGISGVPWDAVELPSQFLENWCWAPEALVAISGHYQTGKPLPDDLLDKLRGARNFQCALQMLRQLEFSIFDMAVHGAESLSTAQAIQQTLDTVREKIAVVRTPAWNRFQNSFSHIFAGGYAAGYYSYKWAEVLSADAFSRFEEDGIFDPRCGRDFLQLILESGGVNDPLDNFIAFRGREPSVEALLRHNGLEK